jgi:hypothetical protein
MVGGFKDATGHEWQWPTMNLRKVNYLRDQKGVNLRTLLSRDNEEAALKLTDDECLFDLFTDLCKDAIAASGLSSDDLMDRWDETTVPAAREALMESFFTYSQGSKQAALIMQKIRETEKSPS